MRDPSRIDRILEKLGSVWKANPDLRLCQLVRNLSGKTDSFFVEDPEIEAALDLYDEVRPLDSQFVRQKIEELFSTFPLKDALHEYFSWATETGKYKYRSEFFEVLPDPKSKSVQVGYRDGNDGLPMNQLGKDYLLGWEIGYREYERRKFWWPG